MIIRLFFLSIFIGIIIARIQLGSSKDPRRNSFNIFRLLMQTVLFALITGLLLHQLNLIDSIRLYLYLISTGTSLGLFMMLERLEKKYWLTVILTSISAGIICYLFMNYNTDHVTNGSVIVGIAPGIGYLILGLIKKQWVIRIGYKDID